MKHHSLAEQHYAPQAALLETVPVDPLDIGGLCRCIWQGKWIIAASTIMALVVAGYYAFAIAQPRYAASVTVKVAKPLSIAGEDIAGPNLNSEIAILRSHTFLNQVATALELQKDPTFNRYLMPMSPWSLTALRTRVRTMLTGQLPVVPDDEMIRTKTLENLSKVMQAQANEDSGVLTIRVTSGLGERAIQIANTIAATYIQDQLETARIRTENTLSWLSAKVSESQIALAEKEVAITELISQSRAADQVTFDELTRQAMDTDKRLRDARAILAGLRSGDPSTTQNPLSINARRIEGQIAVLQDVRADLTSQLAQQSTGLARLNQLQREADASRVLYDTFLARLQNTTLLGAVEDRQSRILSPAGPAQYVATRKTFLIGLAAVLGAVLGTCLVVARDATRSGFREPGQLRDATGLPVMGQIPALRLRNPVQLLDKISLPATQDVQDAATALRTALLVSGADEPPQTILCTSSIRGEAQTLLSITLAQAFANLGKSVLLLDGDQRGQGVVRYVPAAKSGRLTDVINGQIMVSHAIYRDPRWPVDVLAAQKTRSSDVFCSAPFANMMHRLRENYDYIIINASPILDGPDAAILAQHTDGVVYAVKCDRTPLDLIKAGQDTLENVHAPISTLVMTGVAPRHQQQRANRSLFARTGLHV
ncbi:MAG: Wzz/FepE/Etk N-terminal domain-containing protein [Pseudomonadota bacterium]